MSHPTHLLGQPGDQSATDQAIAADTAALNTIIQLALRAATAAVTRLEDLTAKAAGWSDPRELDATLPVTRMARCIRQCIALKARLPALYAAGLLPPRTPIVPHPRPTPPRRPRAEDAESLFTDHEPFFDTETLEDPPDSPLTQGALARYAADLTQTTRPPRQTPAHADHEAADAIETALSDRLDDEDFPTLLATLGAEELTRKLRRDLGLRAATPHLPTGPP